MSSKRKSVFVAQHVAREGQDDEDVMFIGVYTSRESAAAAVARLRGHPGFSEFPDGFDVDEYELDKDYWTEGFGRD